MIKEKQANSLIAQIRSKVTGQTVKLEETPNKKYLITKGKSQIQMNEKMKAYHEFKTLAQN